jgi:long-chain acyl-CoA synthetase
VQIGFSRGDPKLLIEDIQALQPTIFVGVPRLFAKVYDKVSEHLKTLLIILLSLTIHEMDVQ